MLMCEQKVIKPPCSFFFFLLKRMNCGLETENLFMSKCLPAKGIKLCC